MLSLVCAYNNEDKLKSELLSSLKFQKNVKYELILVNTVKENIKSASEALNRGGKQVMRENILFSYIRILYLKMIIHFMKLKNIAIVINLVLWELPE